MALAKFLLYDRETMTMCTGMKNYIYKLWLKRLTVDYIKISEEKFDSDHYANDKRVIMSHLFNRALSRI